MKLYEIKDKRTQHILYEQKAKSFKETIEKAIQDNVCLNGADLSFQNLSNTNLDNAQLSYADFSNSNLSNANLSESCFKRSNFSNANMVGSCMAESDFTAVDFLYSDFGSNILSACTLDSAKFNTFSGFQLPFIQSESMQSCAFYNREILLFKTSRPPIVVIGLDDAPLLMAENNIYRGHNLLVSQYAENKNLRHLQQF